MKTIYECSQSKMVKWITAIFILAMVLGVLTEIYYVSRGMDVTVAIIVSAVLLAVAFSCFFVFPLYIISDDEGIGVRTLARTIWIPFENIDHIERMDDKHPLFINNGKIGKATLGFSYQWGMFSAGNTIRLFGIGGVFGYIGWFRTKGIGTFLSYVTDEKNAFLIYRIKGKPVAISVTEPDEFMPFYLKGGEK